MTATQLKSTNNALSRRQRRRTMTSRERAGRVSRKTLTNILIIVILIVEIYPLFWILSSSFKSQNEFETEPLWSLPTVLNFQNYVDAWNTAQLGTDAINSLIVTLVSMAIVLVLGCGAAFALEVMVWKGRGKVLLFIVGGLMVPIQLILLPLFTIYFKIGLTNSLWPLIITYVGQGLPLTVFLMATYFRSVPRELFEACTLDGGSIYRCFVSVGVPLVRNGIFTMALLLFFSIWNDLLIALTFNSSPQLSTVQVGLLNFNGQYGQTTYGPLFAAISIVIFATLVVYALINQQVMKGLTAGSVKG
ncbi:MAG TPA: carbohydrate ABC transporter permease [Galbitalea sp.]|jgi:raffinose/stachyose/melibiose transport system permease protein|nr:carbohydrate ABC transporter permease [Galbitalea sp.]